MAEEKRRHVSEDDYYRRKLTAHNPDQRSSTPHVAASPWDVANVAVEKKASQSLQDTVKVDEENAKPPTQALYRGH
jgi:hypothetical protein